jgi:hypothetical protein
MEQRPRLLETPNGPERTDLPYEFEICNFLDEIDHTVLCPQFTFTIRTEHPDPLKDFFYEQNSTYPRTLCRQSTEGNWVLANGHVLGPSIYYRIHAFERTWFEYFIGLPYRQCVDITAKLLGSSTNDRVPQ